MRKRMHLVIAWLALATVTAAAQDFSRIEIDAVRLGDSLHLLSSRAGGNVAVCAGEDGLLIVDSEYRELNEKLKAALAGISDEAVRYVVNTHWHFDHVGGNEIFGSEGAVIIAHENVRKRMAVDHHITIIDTDVPASPSTALPVITYRERLSLHLNGREITLLHMPRAHTDGDTVVRFCEDDVIHVGDILFHPGYPFIDVSVGGGIDGMIDAASAVLKLCGDETRIIPGHGPLASKADLEAYVEMLKAFREIVAREKSVGKSLEEILDLGATATLDEKWGRRYFPPRLFTEMVFHTVGPD